MMKGGSPAPDRVQPSLDDLLDDPVMTALLRRDGLDAAQVRRIMAEMKTRLTGKSP